MLYRLVKSLVLPPGLNILLVLVGLALLMRWRRTGAGFIALGVLSLYLLSTSAGTRLVAGEWEAVPLFEQPGAAGAIVVLGGGRNREAPEYGGGDVVSMYTLVRLRYAARLHRRTGLPLLVSGGRVSGEEPEAEATLMAEALTQDFRVPVRWREDGSRDTFANAAETARLLRAEGIDTVVLVTHAVHMRRARTAFEAEGLGVIPAPTYFMLTPGGPLGAEDFVPTLKALAESHYALHERVGALWYRLRRGF